MIKQRANAPSTSQDITIPRPSFLEMALLCATLIVIAFQSTRHEAYDTEKTGLLGLLVAALIAGTLYSNSLKFGSFRKWFLNWRALTATPLHKVVFVWLAINLTPSLFSLTPAFSFWGEPSRAQGSLTLCLYVMVFLQAASLGQSARRAIVPFLLMAGIPLWLEAFSLYAQQADRTALGGATGNPNFLASWSVMVVVYCTPQIGGRIAEWARPFSGRQWATLMLYAALLLPIACVPLLTASRGALLGFLVAVLFIVISLAALTGKRRLLIGMGSVAVVCLLVYLGVGLWLRTNPDQGSQRNNSLSRLFTFSDQVRIDLWSGAAHLIALQTEPMLTIDRHPDPLAFLRPFIGYGPETTEQLQSRIGDIFTNASTVNSFHNQSLDVVITTGWLGLLIWLTLLGTAVYSGLQIIGFLRTGRRWHWIAWIVGSAVSVAIFFSLIIAPDRPAALFPVGAGLGAAFGLLICVALQGRMGSDGYKNQVPLSAILVDKNKMVALGVLAVLLAQWIDNQFGFATATTQPLWWILLGLLAGTLARTQGTTSDLGASAIEPDTRTWAWISAGLGAGLFTIYSFSNALGSQSIRIHAEAAQLPFMLLGILVAGSLGVVLSESGTTSPLSWRRALYALACTLLLWSIFFGLRLFIVNAAGSLFDHALSLSDPARLTDDLGTGARLLSVEGIVLILVSLLGNIILKAIFEGKWSAILLNRRSALAVGLTLGLVLAAGLFYSTAYTGGVLQHIGVILLENPPSPTKSQELTIAVAALDASSTDTPVDVYVQLQHAIAMINQLNFETDVSVQAAVREHIGQVVSGIFRQQPYFVNTLAWRNFSEAYGQLFNPSKQ